MSKETSAHDVFRAGSRSYGFGSTQVINVAFTASQGVSSTNIPKGEYRVVASQGCWFTQAASPTATVAGTGCAYMPPNVPELMQFNGNEKIAAIRASADGHVSLIKVD